MSRYVNADAICYAADEVAKECANDSLKLAVNQGIKNLMNRMHSIDIVRCKDCKHRKSSDCVGSIQTYECDITGFRMHDLTNHFCSYGERSKQTSDLISRCDQSMETAEPTKVYAVTEGEYSDYGICAMFSDRSKAIEYIERRARSHDGYTGGPYYIEEYDLNQEKALGEIRMFRAQGPLVGGALVIKETDRIDHWGTRARDVIITDHDNPDKRAVEGQFYTIIFAKDEEHASKIAYDKRAKLAARILIDGYGARID